MKFVLSTVLLTLSLSVFAQVPYNKANLQKQNAQLKKAIINLNKQLEVNKQNSKLNVDFVQNLTKKIQVQTKLVNNLSKEKRFIEDEIYLTQLEINKLSRELVELKKDYKQVLVRAYKNKSVENKLLFVLSSKSLGEAYRRIKYLEKYSAFQLGQANEIIGKQTDIQTKKAKKEKAKDEKEKVLSQQTLFSQNLEKERLTKEKAVEEFRKNEGVIAAEINAKEAQQRQIDAQIKAIIEEEIRQAKIRAEKDLKDWNEAKRGNSIASYNEYLRDNPKGDYAKSARTAILRIENDAKAWNIARSAHTKQAYQSYLTHHPTGSFVSTAKTEISKFEQLEREAEAEEDARLKAQKEEDARKIAAAKAEAERKAKIEAEQKVVVKVPEKERVVKVDAVKPAETFAERPDSEGISGEFSSNRGRLPWPVDKGTVVSRFGSNSHPVLSNITTQNSGVDISTYRGAHARAVYEGTVQAVMSVSGNGKSVLVRHGSYYSVYTNLSSVSVSKGDDVKRGQSLGIIYTSGDGETVMNFQIWSGTTKQNPASWVAGM